MPPTITYELIDNAGGKVSLVNGQLRVAGDLLSSTVLNPVVRRTVVEDFTIPITVSGTASNEVLLLIGSDAADDVDDAAMMAVANALQNAGEARILAVCASGKGDYNVSALAAMMKYHAREHVPVGAYKGSGSKWGFSNWAPVVRDNFGFAGKGRANFPDAVTVWRQALVDAPRKTVLVEVGSLNNVAALLKSPADAISPLTGAQLVADKVDRMVLMGGDYPTSSFEYNFDAAVADAAYVADNSPVDVYFLGFTAGETVKSSPAGTTNPALNPYKTAFDAYVAGGGQMTNVNGTLKRASFDPLTLLFAVRGVGPHFSVSERGVNTVNTSTAGNTFTVNPAGKHFYVIKAQDNTTLGGVLDGLIDAAHVAPYAVPAPAVTLVGTTSTTAVLSISDVPGAYGYEYSVDGGAWQTLAADRIVTGLSPATTYGIRVRGTRLGTGGTASATVSATTTVATYYEIASDPDALVFLMAKDITGVADGANLTSWASRVGGITAAHANADNQPKFKAVGQLGAPCATLDGSNDRMQFNNISSFPTGSDPCTMIAIAYSAAGGYRAVVSYGDSANQRIMLIHADTNGPGFVTQPGGTATISPISWSGASHIVAMWQTSATTAAVEVDGQDTPTTGNISTMNTPASGTTGGIGAAYGRSGNDPWSGEIYAVAIFRGALTKEKRQKVIGAMAHEVGAGALALLPANYPYKSTRPLT